MSQCLEEHKTIKSDRKNTRISVDHGAVTKTYAEVRVRLDALQHFQHLKCELRWEKGTEDLM